MALAKPRIVALLKKIVDGDKLTVMAALKKLDGLVDYYNPENKEERAAVCKSDGATKFAIALKSGPGTPTLW